MSSLKELLANVKGKKTTLQQFVDEVQLSRRNLISLSLHPDADPHKKKTHFKVYIPVDKWELYQTFAIWIKLAGFGKKSGHKGAISKWFMQKIYDQVDYLNKTDDPEWKTAQEILRELRRVQFKTQYKQYREDYGIDEEE